MKDQVLDQHVDDLRLPYLEGLLGPEETSKFEDHVRQCPACASKLEEMSRWASVFKANAHQMCPEGWRLFDYAATGRDPAGMVSAHLAQCPSCLAEVESFKADASKQTMPADLWQKMQNMSRAPVADRDGGRSRKWAAEALDRLRELFRPLILAPVAAAVVILLVVLLYPTGPTPRMVALSSVKWGTEPSALKLMGKDLPGTLPTEAKKERLGAVILLSNFKRPPDRDFIDSVYWAIKPPKDVRDRYDVVSPEELQRVAGAELSRTTNDKALVEAMRATLTISKALVIEIVADRERYGIVGRLVGAANGDTIRTRDLRNLTEAELIPALKDATQSLLSP